MTARAVHEASGRAGGPFIAVNCAAISETLLESELFGYRKGAFTGADSDREGLFEAAHQGTLFLDEIGEAGLAVQAKLLRVLEEKKINRVGDPREREVDVRVLAATNRPLEDAIASGTFREDLYYRLLVFPLDVPPLRDRADDIPLLVEHFLSRVGPPPDRPARQGHPAAAGSPVAGQRARAAEPGGTGPYPGRGPNPLARITSVWIWLRAAPWVWPVPVETSISTAMPAS